MTETPPAAPPATPPATPDDELAGLDDNARRLVERANSEAAAMRHDLRESQAALERMQRDHETAQDRLIREAEDRGRQSAGIDHERAIQEYERRLVTLAVEARAANRFNDPQDAILNLPIDDLVSERDERQRMVKIDAALDGLLKAKPYLERKSDRTAPLVTQGGRSERGNGQGRERSWLRG